MIKTISLALFLLVTTFYNNVANAQDEPVFAFGNTTFFGSGCPEGTVQIITSSDGQTVSVLFSEYIAETEGSSKRDRLSCNLAVPVDVSPGFSLGIYKVDYRGFVDVANDAKRDYARFYAEYFFAGIRGPTMTRTFDAGFSDDFYISNEVNVASVVYSPCGASTVFRINTSITASKASTKEGGETVIGIDTIDTTIAQSENFGFVYFFQQEPCSPIVSPTPGSPPTESPTPGSPPTASPTPGSTSTSTSSSTSTSTSTGSD